jgi:hypothetical protein
VIFFWIWYNFTAVPKDALIELSSIIKYIVWDEISRLHYVRFWQKNRSKCRGIRAVSSPRVWKNKPVAEKERLWLKESI